MKTPMINLFAILSLCFAFSCANKSTNQTALTKEPILIGAIYNHSGDQSQYGIDSSLGALLAVKEINDAGGVLGRTLQLVQYDGETDSARIAEEAGELAGNPDISIAIGLNDSDLVLAAAPPFAASKKIFITSGATSPLLPDEAPTYLFLSCFGDNTQAAAGAEFAFQRLGLQSAAILYDADRVYTVGLANYFRDRFAQLGGAILSIQPYKNGSPSLAKQIEVLRSLDITPQLIYLSAETPAEAAQHISELRSAGFDQPIMGGDGFVADRIISAAGEAANNVYFSTHVYYDVQTKNPALKRFMELYNSAYNAYPTNPFAALAYDAVNLVASAMRRAGSVDPQALLEALNDTKDFQGATGSISYQNGERVPLKSVSLVHIDNGKAFLAAKWMPESIPEP